MMGLFRSLTGTVTVELTGADIAGSLHRISEGGIRVADVRILDELTARMQLQRRDFGKLRRISEAKGDRIQLKGRSGLYWSGKLFLKRPVLVFGLILLLTAAILIPSRVLFVRVEGNEILPDNRILEAARNCGIGFGASRRAVRSERMKNALLAELPQLQWAGVNTYGCVAEISVRERAAQETARPSGEVSSIVADRDGVILSVTVTDGNGLCRAGQAVKKGDVLISGYTDCGLCITATRAEGEILAGTRRVLTAKTPSLYQIRRAVRDEKTKWSLIVGKNRINFYKGSGICDATCVKMYTEYCLTLPGGFELPVKLVKESTSEYETQDAVPGNIEAETQLSEFASNYLRTQMVAGSITDRIEAVKEIDGAWRLAGEYACTEMIGKVQTEEIGVIP